MKDFRKLSVWSKSHALTLQVYAATTTFPKVEQYGLTSQIRRACVSIAANIAEGCGKAGDADFRRFLLIAMGSESEFEYYIVLSRDLNYLTTEDHEKLLRSIIEVKSMLAALIKKLTK